MDSLDPLCKILSGGNSKFMSSRNVINVSYKIKCPIRKRTRRNIRCEPCEGEGCNLAFF